MTGPDVKSIPSAAGSEDNSSAQPKKKKAKKAGKKADSKKDYREDKQFNEMVNKYKQKIQGGLDGGSSAGKSKWFQWSLKNTKYYILSYEIVFHTISNTKKYKLC